MGMQMMQPQGGGWLGDYTFKLGCFDMCPVRLEQYFQDGYVEFCLGLLVGWLQPQKWYVISWKRDEKGGFLS